MIRISNQPNTEPANDERPADWMLCFLFGKSVVLSLATHAVPFIPYNSDICSSTRQLVQIHPMKKNKMCATNEADLDGRFRLITTFGKYRNTKFDGNDPFKKGKESSFFSSSSSFVWQCLRFCLCIYAHFESAFSKYLRLFARLLRISLPFVWFLMFFLSSHLFLLLLSEPQWFGGEKNEWCHQNENAVFLKPT